VFSVYVLFMGSVSACSSVHYLACAFRTTLVRRFSKERPHVGAAGKPITWGGIRVQGSKKIVMSVHSSQGPVSGLLAESGSLFAGHMVWHLLLLLIVILAYACMAGACQDRLGTGLGSVRQQTRNNRVRGLSS
jgi:hypothetical protein